MMMDHHRFIKPSKASNVMIGGSGSRSSSSDTTDELTGSDPAITDDFDDPNNALGTTKNTMLNGRSSPTMQPPTLFGDDAFDKITMDFDNSDLDTSVNSMMLLDKLSVELDGISELKGIGISPGENSKGKLGDVGDELDMELLDVLVEGDERATGQGQNQEGSDSLMDQLLKENNSDSSLDRLLNIPLIDMDGQNLPPTVRSSDIKNKNDSNTANINLSLKNVGSDGSLCDSMGSLPSIGKISPNASFAALNNVGMQTSVQEQIQQQQLFLQQQMQQQQNNSQNNSSNNGSSIQSIVNNQLSQLPQANQLTKLGVAGLEHEKMKLIQRLQQIENSGMPMNVNQQQQQQQEQFLLQKQMFLQQQQQRIGSASSMPSLRTGGQMLQGMQIQGQQQNNFMNQRMMQQQQAGMAQGMMSQSMAVNNNMNMNNSNNNSRQMQSSMFGNTGGSTSNISSIMGSKGKDTPLLSFLRNKTRASNNNNNNMVSMVGQQLAATSIDSNMVGAPNHSSSTSSSGILDAAPIDFSTSSTNPFLRKQMMNNLDKSVNVRGRIGGLSSGRRLSSSIRRNMMQQMTSKSCHEPRREKSTDSYESAGILGRVSSADHIPSRRAGLTAGAAKAQNRRFTLSRSNNSLGNLTKTKTGSRRDLAKSGGVSSKRSLLGGGSSTRSLGSNDSGSSLIPIKRRGSISGGRGKHKLGSGGGSARRISSVPYLGSSLSESAAMIQQRMEENQQQEPRHNDGWP